MIKCGDGGQVIVGVEDYKGNDVTRDVISKQKLATELVRRWNAHDAMREALESAWDLIDYRAKVRNQDIEEEFGEGASINTPGGHPNEWLPVRDQIESALVQATNSYEGYKIYSKDEIEDLGLDPAIETRSRIAHKLSALALANGTGEEKK